MLFGFDLPFPKSCPARRVSSLYTETAAVKRTNTPNKKRTQKQKKYRIGGAPVCPENRAHTHSLMVEKPLSSSCLRSITAVSLKPPPERLSAAAASTSSGPSLPIIGRLQRRSIDAASPVFSSSSGHVPVIISPLEVCRSVETADRKGYNSGLTQLLFRRSAVTGWLLSPFKPQSCEVGRTIDGPLVPEMFLTVRYSRSTRVLVSSFGVAPERRDSDRLWTSHTVLR